MEPEIAFFDMDHTVLGVDAEQAWKHLLIELGMCDEEDRGLSQHYLDLHAVGKTPRDEYQKFLLREFIGRTPEELAPLADENFQKHIRHEVYDEAIEAIAAYGERQIPTVLLTGTNRLIVDTIEKYLGVTDVICTELEIEHGRYTGRIDGLFRIQEHKVSGALDQCRERGTDLERIAYYGDSVSDVPMFEAVGMPYVVNPSEQLALLARERGWKILRWGSKPALNNFSQSP